MSQAEDCPKGCKHESFHYCHAEGTHCDIHCICPCSSCIADRKNPGPNDPEMGGRILPGSVIVRGESGQALAEYGLILALIAIVSLGLMIGIAEGVPWLIDEISHIV